MLSAGFAKNDLSPPRYQSLATRLSMSPAALRLAASRAAPGTSAYSARSWRTSGRASCFSNARNQTGGNSAKSLAFNSMLGPSVFKSLPPCFLAAPAFLHAARKPSYLEGKPSKKAHACAPARGVTRDARGPVERPNAEQRLQGHHRHGPGCRSSVKPEAQNFAS